MPGNDTQTLRQEVDLKRQTTICLTGDSVTVHRAADVIKLPLRTLPQAYIDWFDRERRGMHAQLMGKDDTVRCGVPHLPVLVTHSEDKPFLFDCSNQAVSFIPKEKHLSEFIELFQRTLRDTHGKSGRQSLEARLETASRFYFDRDKIDYRALGTLALLERTVSRNMARTPLAGLHFTGDCSSHTSFQLNCAVEMLSQNDPRHTFINLARRLSQNPAVDLVPPRSCSGYIFWITDLQDTTAFPAKEQLTSACASEATDAHPDTAYAVRPQSRNAVADYRKIYVCLDGSESANGAMGMSFAIGKQFGAELIGSHVYAAKLHDRRFRAMESGLPEAYRKEQALEQQRTVHESLITKGLELISDSYLNGLETLCNDHHLSFTGVSLEGTNWQALARDITRHDYDLIALGGHGVGQAPDALLGTVTERILRKVKRDILICKVDPDQNESDRIVVCLDGSSRSWGALKRGVQLAVAFSKRLVAISAFDPYFHHMVFSTLNKILSDKARQVFKFKEQEQLHETIIDSGLAKIYQCHLDMARRIAAEDGLEIETHLLDGKAYQQILDFNRPEPPWLLVMGRTGIHGDEELDIGGQTERVCRLADCNLLIVDTKFEPSARYRAEATVTWTHEAESYMQRVPTMARGMATRAIEQHVMAEGHTVVTLSLVEAAITELLPPALRRRMGIGCDDSDGKCMAKDMSEHVTSSFQCSACRHVRHGSQPKQCPICGADGSAFARIEAPATFVWTDAAAARLERVPAGFMRNAAKASVEGYAAETGLREISLAVADWGLNKARAKMATITQGEPTGMQGGVKTDQGRRLEPPESASFECGMCGYVVDGDSPGRCSACENGDLRKMTKTERERASDTSVLILEWNQDALERIERIPEGFIRKMTQCRIEHWARQSGHARVTLDLVEAKYRNWIERVPATQPRLEWSPDASARAEKIPAFIRPMVIGQIERSAELCGNNRIDGAVLDTVLGGWDRMEAFHRD